jgi:hypothetical protein
MTYQYYTRLKIEIEESGSDELDSLNSHRECFESEMSDCSIHAWFAAFEKVLRFQGFTDLAIAKGACQLAFNPYRETEIMRKVAHEYDLELAEDEPENRRDCKRPASVVVTAD